MSLPKKRKISGLDGKELATAYASLRSFRNTITEDESERDPNEPLDIAQLDAVLSQLLTRLSGPRSLTFSSADDDDLAKLNITLAGLLQPKPDFENALKATTSLGEEEHWSSKGFYRHLELLENTIPNVNETSARAWIDSFFYRVCAMLPKDKRMVLNMEHHVPSTKVDLSSETSRSLSGYIDYTAVVAEANASSAGLLDSPYLSVLKRYMQTRSTSTGFFVLEAKFTNIAQHVPQAICEMYACGKYLQKNVVRGALTSGRQWMFLILNINDDFGGATYKQSAVISFTSTNMPNGQRTLVSPLWPNYIAATLLHWIQNGFTDLGDDDWLVWDRE
ncbi:hypothetical protein FPV67DRAFT_1476688 [Lyophyllum atratum]|nr:hypothetical protein FPV67DRAFT_1476688 [Lyophyllum atratum]